MAKDSIRRASSRACGLVGMRERAALVEGMLTIESGPSVGTTYARCFPAVVPGLIKVVGAYASGTHPSSRPSWGFPQPRDR